VDFMNYLAISRLFFSRKCFSENKKINFFYPFPFFSFSPSSFFAQSLKSIAAPSILGPVAAQHPQLAAQPYPSNHRVKSVEAPQTLLAHLLFHLGPTSFSPAPARSVRLLPLSLTCGPARHLHLPRRGKPGLQLESRPRPTLCHARAAFLGVHATPRHGLGPI
jgi:hypothetical protein